MAATRAGVERRLDDAVRAGRQRAGDAGATAARRLRALRTVWLPALGRGRARVARRLARRVEPGLQFRDPRRQRTDLRSLRFSLRLLRQDQGKQVVLGKSLEDLAVHGRRSTNPTLALSSQTFMPPMGRQPGQVSSYTSPAPSSSLPQHLSSSPIAPSTASRLPPS